jgi:hypothetical protein
LSPADISTIRSGVRPIGHPEVGPESSPDPDVRENKALVDLLQTQLERAQAEAVDARVALAAAQERWEARLDGLAADLAEARQTRLAEAEANARREVELQRMQTELERLRARPWWRRLLDPG